MPVDDLYADSTNTFLNTYGQLSVPTPRTEISSSIGSLAKAVGRGVPQGGTRLFGAVSDFAAGANEAYVDPSLSLGAALNPGTAELIDKHVNDTIAKARGGHLFESRVGTAAYDLADTFKANPTDTSRLDQTVQEVVSGLVQVVPATLGGLPLAAAAGALSFGFGSADDLKRQGVDVGTRSKIGAISGGLGAAGALLPVAGRTGLQTLGLVGVGGVAMPIGQGFAEKAILKNANYDSLADQRDPLDPYTIAAGVALAGAMGGGAHAVRAARGGSPGSLASPPDVTAMPVAQRKALPYNSPSLDAYATQVAQQNGVPPAFLLFIKNGGERSNSDQVSPKGAKGVMQFIDDTWTAYGKGADPTDPVASIDAAGAYARDLLNRYNGNVRAAAAEYNGGVSQAKRVMAGLEPNKPETVAYVKRLDEYRISPDEMRFTPTGEQVDAALTLYGRRMLDDAHPFGISDVDAYNTHQALTDFAVRQMNAGAFPDVARYITETDSLRAQALDGLIADAENGYQTLSGQAAQLADPGAVTAARNEIAAMGTRPGDAEVRALTDQIQQQGTKFKAAQKEATKQVEQMQADFDARLQRLQGAIAQNADAQRATNQLPAAESTLAALREQRATLDVPATKRAPIADYVRQVAEAYRNDTAAPRVSRAVDDAWAMDAGPVHIAPRVDLIRQGGQDAASTLPETANAVDTNLRALQDLEPDTRVHVDANQGQVEGRLADVMKVIDDEHAATIEDSKLFEVAANCFISRGI